MTVGCGLRTHTLLRLLGGLKLSPVREVDVSNFSSDHVKIEMADGTNLVWYEAACFCGRHSALLVRKSVHPVKRAKVTPKQTETILSQ